MNTKEAKNALFQPGDERTRILLGAIGAGSSLLSLGLMWFVHPLAAVALPIAIALTFAYLFWEVTGTLMFTIVLLLRPGEILHPAFHALKLGKVTAGACLAAWLFHFVFLGRRQWSRDVLGWLLLGLTGSILVSTVVSTDPGRSQQFLTDVWLKLVILFYAIVHLTCRPIAMRIYIGVLVGLSSFLAFLGIHKGLTSLPEDLIEGNRVGIGEFLADPNDFAQMLTTLGLAYVLSLLFAAPKWKKKLVYIALLCVLLGGVGMTRSRGGFLGAAGTALVVVSPYLSPVALAVGGAAVAAGGVVYLIRSGRFRSDGLDDSAQGRLDAWFAAVYMFRDRPITGVGYECYVVNYLSYANDPVDWKPKAVHSSWFKVIAELGLLGSLFFFPIVFLSLLRAFRLRKWAMEKLIEPGDWWLRAIFMAMFPALLGWCISGTFLSNSFHWFLYIQIALIISASMIKTTLETERFSVALEQEGGSAALPAPTK
jgi:O-antigen ligase